MKFPALFLDRRKVIAGLGGAAALCLLLGVYLPLTLRVKEKGRELLKLESEVKEAKDSILSAKRIYAEDLYLPKQEEVSWVIDEMTALGKGLGIDFRSIRPQEVQKEESGYSFVPVEMTVESSYKELGQFIGSLKGLKKGFVTVGHFEIRRDEKMFPKLSCRLLVKIVLHP